MIWEKRKVLIRLCIDMSYELYKSLYCDLKTAVVINNIVHININILGVQLRFRFFSEIRGFIVKNWLYIYDSKYCPSLATTFSHLSGSVRIPRRKNWSSFEAIHESIQFFTSS